MDEKVALIAGGAKGIGAAIALALADRGWAVATCYRKSKTEAEALNAKLEKKGRAMTVCADVSDAAAAQRLVAEVEEKMGRIDALINCAGPYHRVNLLEETVEGWHEMFDNNFAPAFLLESCGRNRHARAQMGKDCQLLYGQCPTSM